MDTLTQNLSTLLEFGITNSMPYPAYRALMAEMVATHSTTGLDKSESMVGYTILNEQRMKRWDKTLKVSADAQEKIANFKGDVTWLVLTESWCGDAAHVIPVINKVAELHPNIDLKLVLRDDNDDLMQQFLTNGGKSIPKLIMIDNVSGTVIDTFGPRPTGATQMIEDYMKAHGAITDEIKENLQGWYNKDKGQNTIQDLLTLLGVA
ncbi:thioredoxin family protein [Gelidibacter salicanalis]|uniref:Thioredoxin family protein n=1 Tax=Gelidibacter salicanalis TaxID=291193 RepID=A0A5C7AJV9_9FLAO|nr:thioredoxin family protein [Gelidibacter salicanalis]TXE09006.1 thioredoxin family protein [Gelidibacter salicanalis]